MARMKLSPPWCQRYSQIAALFKYDPAVHVIFDEDNYEVKLYVDDDDKAAALTILLPEEYEFGNIKLKIQVVPAKLTVRTRFSGARKILFSFRL